MAKNLKEITQEVTEATGRVNIQIEELGKHSDKIHTALNELQEVFDSIRNVPTDEVITLQELKEVRLNWINQVEKIEKEFDASKATSAGTGVVGAAAGVTVAALGPTAAMGIATTFGVASTGTAISTLSGAAATNAALAWLGGGALVAGGGGMSAGSALLALAGPLGWTIAGASALIGGLMFFGAKNTKDRLENIFKLIGMRDLKKYQQAEVELRERIERTHEETRLVTFAIREIKTYGKDYNEMSEKQKYTLGSYVNLMNSATQLLVNPVYGLQPSFSEEDLERYTRAGNYVYKKDRPAVLSLSNLLYKIDMNEDDKKTIKLKVS